MHPGVSRGAFERVLRRCLSTSRGCRLCPAPGTLRSLESTPGTLNRGCDSFGDGPPDTGTRSLSGSSFRVGAKLQHRPPAPALTVLRRRPQLRRHTVPVPCTHRVFVSRWPWCRSPVTDHHAAPGSRLARNGPPITSSSTAPRGGLFRVDVVAARSRSRPRTRGQERHRRGGGGPKFRGDHGPPDQHPSR